MGVHAHCGLVWDVLGVLAGVEEAEVFALSPFGTSYSRSSSSVTALELADPDDPPSLGDADHRSEHVLEDGPLGEGVGNDLEPLALLDIQALKEVRIQYEDVVALPRPERSNSWSRPGTDSERTRLILFRLVSRSHHVDGSGRGPITERNKPPTEAHFLPLEGVEEGLT